MSLFISNRQASEKLSLELDPELIRQILAPVLVELEIVELDLEIELLNDRQIAELNEKFFSRPWPTNVISFSQEKEEAHLGDVVVSVETARRETQELGYSLEEGVVYYLIHGILHLLGFEHVGVDAQEAVEMESRQDELFALALNVI